MDVLSSNPKPKNKILRGFYLEVLITVALPVLEDFLDVASEKTYY